jgi:hypothetical protein
LPVKKTLVENTRVPKASPDSAAKRLAPAAEKATLAREVETPLPMIEPKAAPAGEPRPAALKAASAAGPSQGDAMQVLQTFSRYYQAGQLEPFMALFSADAQNDRGGRSAIAEDYGRLFSSSRRRSLELSRLQWQPQGAGWRVNARYSAKVQRDSDLLPVKNKGMIELDFVEEGGRARVRRIALK